MVESQMGIGFHRFENQHAAVFANDCGKNELGYTSKKPEVEKLSCLMSFEHISEEYIGK